MNDLRAGRFEAFVFDLDGTLVDTLPDLVAITNRSLVEEGFPTRTEREILGFVGNGLHCLLRRAVPAGTAERDVVRLRERWRAVHAEVGDPLAEPFAHVVETLVELRGRGFKTAVLSNKYDAGVRQVVESRLPGLFDALLGEGPDVPRKPDPSGYLRVMAQLGVEPACCAYVGDSPCDVLVARNAGTYAVGVTWGYREAADFAAEDALPDCWISDIRELLPDWPCIGADFPVCVSE